MLIKAHIKVTGDMPDLTDEGLRRIAGQLQGALVVNVVDQREGAQADIKFPLPERLAA